MVDKARRKDELVLHYIDKLLRDKVVNIRYAVVELIESLYTVHHSSMSLYKQVDQAFEDEQEEDLKAKIDAVLNVCL